MTSHVETENLALYSEGLLDQEHESTVQAHLAACAECSDALNSLSDITRILAGFSAPPLTEVVSERIDAAWQSEQRNGPASTANSEIILQSGKVRPFVSKTRSSRWTPYLIAAAAVVFLAGGGVAGVSALLTDSGQDAPSTADDSAAQPEEFDAAQPYHPEIVASGIDYTEDDLDRRIAGVINASDLPYSVEGDAAPEDPADSPSPPSEIITCVHRISTDTGHRPELIDIASYEDTPAWILVFDGSVQTVPAAEYLVRVVPESCGSPGDSTVEVIDEVSVPFR